MVDPAYDPAGRLDTLTFPRGTVDVAYDVAGRVSVLTAPDLGRVTYAWDGFLPRGETWTGSVAGAVTRTYDTDFRLRTQSVNAGSTVTLNYDPDKLLTSLTGAVALTVRRDATNGSMTGTTAGAVVTAQTFSGYGELDTWSATASAAPLYSFDLDQDDLGRITLKTETVQGVTVVSEYGYDLAGRLADVWQDGGLVAHYDYDENGNRVGVTEAGVTTTGTVDVQDRLLTWGATTFTYGHRGDLQSRTDASGTTGYVTDALGNLVSATLPDGTSLSYVIDANNRRIGKRRGGVLQQGFLYDGQLRIVAELSGANALVSRFVYGTRGNVPDLMVRGGITYRLLSDHLGSVRLVVRTSNGAVVQRLDYDEWGNVLADTNPGFQPFGFAGGLYDRDTRLVRFGARDYDPSTGRWISKDPIRFAGGDSNIYAYAGGDPVNRIDPNGKFGVLFWVGVAAGAAALYVGNEDAKAAEAYAANTGLPGPHNGPQDALRHCIWQCNAAQDVGSPAALAFGEGVEALGTARGEAAAETKMDLNNNLCGRKLAGWSPGDDRSCEEKCEDALPPPWGPGGGLEVLAPNFTPAYARY